MAKFHYGLICESDNNRHMARKARFGVVLTPRLIWLGKEIFKGVK